MIMALGPGKYDDYCKQVRDDTKATGVLLIVCEGNRGNGISVRATQKVSREMPYYLRMLADTIEKEADGLSFANN